MAEDMTKFAKIYPNYANANADIGSLSEGQYVDVIENQDRFKAIAGSLVFNSKLKNSINVLDYGADRTGTSLSTVAIQKAISLATATKSSLYFPAGVYLHNAAFVIPSNSYWYGDGVDATILKLANGTAKRTNNITIQSVQNVVLSGMTLDGNWSNRTSASEGSGSYDGTSLLIRMSSNIYIDRVYAKNPYRHCIDVTGQNYVATGGDPTKWAPNPSRYIWLNACKASGGRDDNITTHQSSDIWITDCESWDPIGGYINGNNNCLEIDDGSRHVFVSNFLGVGGNNGIQIKGHNDSAAPYDVHITSVRLVNNITPLLIRHTGFYGSDGEAYSPNGRGVSVDGISIIAPCKRSTYLEAGGKIGPESLIVVRSYRGVRIKNVIAYDSSEGDPAGDYEPGGILSNYHVWINGARDVELDKIEISEIKSSKLTSSCGAIYIASANTTGVSITSYRAKNVGGIALYATSATHGIYANDLVAISDIALENSAFYVGASDERSYVGFAYSLGYARTHSPGHGFLGVLPVRGIPFLSGTAGDLGIGSWQINSGSEKNPASGTSLRADTSGNISHYVNNAIKGIRSDATGGMTAYGSIKFSADNAFSVGSASQRAKEFFAASGTINTSDGREKSQPFAIDDAVLDAWGDVQFLTYQWLEAIITKGEDSARLHIGVIAQQVRDVFTKHGIDGTRYGLLCYDEWDNQYEKIIATRINEITGEEEEYDTGDVRLVLAAGNRWGIRADQCFFLEAAWQRRERAKDRAEFLAFKQEVLSILTKARSVEG